MTVQTELFPAEDIERPRCEVCGLMMEPGDTGQVCRHCLADPLRVMQRIDQTVAFFVTRQHAAARRAQDAWDGLTDEERRRWEAYQDALTRQQSGEELPYAVERRLAATIKAYAEQDLSTLTWGLLAMDSAQRLLDKANADLREAEARRERKLAILREACGVHPRGL